MTELYLPQPDGSLTTALLDEESLARKWKGRMKFADLLEQASEGQTRLLRVNKLFIGDGQERRHVSLGHDALAKVAAGWKEELERNARTRKLRVVTAASLAVAGLMFGLAAFSILMWNTASMAEAKARKNEKNALASAQESRRP